MMVDKKLNISAISKSSFGSSDVLTQLYSGFLREQKVAGICRTGPITKTGKNRQVVHMLSLMLLPVAILLGFILYFMGQIVVERTEISQVRSDLTFCLRLGRVIHNIQHERDIQVLGLEQAEQRRYLLGYFDRTDEAVADLPTTLSAGLGQVPGMKNYNVSYIKLELWRERSATEQRDKSKSRFHVYTDVIGVLQEFQLITILRLEYQELWKLLVAYYKLVNSTEEIGKQIQLAGLYLRDGQFERAVDLPAYLRAVDQTHDLIRRSLQYLPATAGNINDKMRTALNKFRWMDPATVLKEVYHERLSLPPEQAVAKYFDEMTSFKNRIFEYQEMLAEVILQQIADYDRSELLVLGVGIMLTLLVFITCPILIRMVYKLTTQLQQCAMHLADATKELGVEKRRTDTLLYQMLPKSVAQKLKRGEVEAEYFRSCSILFCGVNEFEELTLTFTPTDIVNFLNDLFCTLDKVTDKFDVYKVETVGDIYMLSSGVPELNGRDHAAVVASCAIGMLDSMRQMGTAWSKVSLLIGINTGSCMAAVIGSNRPRYCLFGDTVNTAARMQTSSQGDRIQITEVTEKYLRKTKRFIVDPRGMVDIKGKGSMFTYWLIDQVDRPSIHPHHGAFMSISSSELDTSAGSSGLGKSITSSRGWFSSFDGKMTPIEQPIMSAIPEADTGSSKSSENPIPTCEPVLPVGAVGSPLGSPLGGMNWDRNWDYRPTASPTSAASPTSVYDEFADSFLELEERLAAKSGSPPILQLKEGYHF